MPIAMQIPIFMTVDTRGAAGYYNMRLKIDAAGYIVRGSAQHTL